MKTRAYPYIPNSAPETKQAMLEAIGASSIEEIYEDVPQALRLDRPLDLPEPLTSEYALRRHIEGILNKNDNCKTHLNFRGAGCYQHHVPAICDEVNRRGEFLTAYAGEPYDDHGRFQTLFETDSMMGELLDMEMVNVPTYDGFQAAGTALRMANRMNGRPRALIAGTINPDLFSKIKDYCRSELELVRVGFDPVTGLMDLDDLKAKLSDMTSAVFFDNPSFLGVIETQGDRIAELTHRAGAEVIVYADPSSLGILTPPSGYGADIVCGDLQPLGMHMSFGGGQAGFIATRDEERYVQEYPSRLFGIAPTRVPGEYGFGDVAYERTSFAIREEGKEWVGTAAALWGITAGVYLALMGPQGMAELGRGIMQRSRYAIQLLDRIDGVKAPALGTNHFKEFAVDFSGTGKSVAQINTALLDKGIFGGYDLTGRIPGLNNHALMCITEVHTQSDIETLAAAVKEVLS